MSQQTETFLPERKGEDPDSVQIGGVNSDGSVKDAFWTPVVFPPQPPLRNLSGTLRTPCDNP